MRGHSFIERHGDGWRFRVRFPTQLARFVNRGELRLRLGRIDRREALRCARLLRVDADTLFVALGKSMDVETARKKIEDWKRGWLAHFAIRLVDEGRVFVSKAEVDDPDGIGHSIDMLRRAFHHYDVVTQSERIGRALAGFAGERAEFEPVLQAGLAAAGVTDETSPAHRALLTTAALTAYSEIERELDAIGRGNMEATTTALQYAAGGEPDEPEKAAEARPSASQPANATNTSPEDRPNSTTLSFEQTWKSFVEDKIDVTREWKPSRRPELAGTSRLWSWIIGKSPSTITKTDIARFRSVFLRLPANYSRKPDYAETPAEAVIIAAEAVDRKYERVSPKTFNKHLSTLKGYVAWLKTHGHLAVDVEQMFGGLHVKPKRKGRAGRGERNQYSDDDLKRIFSTPVWTGRHSERRLTAPGDYLNRDSLYWGPLLAAFQGARREELAQLRVRHFTQVAGIWLINLNAADLNLKTDDGYENEGSRRLLPLHRDILKLGFLEARVLGRDGNEQLFPELNNNNASESFGAALGKRFGNYQRSLELFPDAEGGFHRFRHTFITRLENTDAKTSFIEELTGHESKDRQSERARYTKEIYVQNLKKTIDCLELPIDIDVLLAAVERCTIPDRRALSRAA
ncbi:tyrosine-type recombinase/integrase [Bosea sp. (in: a-proteobacteria)]|jgi:integrase|uniref:tyrosine-type recombinase/integrase n=1 Tax=Bosea sp. (in: a-proteobacteria) TaxID=1871050 RepID=UPI003F72B4D9